MKKNMEMFKNCYRRQLTAIEPFKKQLPDTLPYHHQVVSPITQVCCCFLKKQNKKTKQKKIGVNPREPSPAVGQKCKEKSCV